MFSIINEVMYIRNYITDYKCGCVYKELYHRYRQASASHMFL